MPSAQQKCLKTRTLFYIHQHYCFTFHLLMFSSASTLMTEANVQNRRKGFPCHRKEFKAQVKNKSVRSDPAKKRKETCAQFYVQKKNRLMELLGKET